MTIEPQIRYAKAPDGVTIAYYSMGCGPALVYMPPTPCTHIELEWKVPELRAAMEQIASVATWVRYDARGFGLSSRDNVTFSLEADENDLDTVVNAVGLKSFTLSAALHQAMSAIAYAAHHPERVTALVLWLPVVSGGDVLGSRYESFMSLARTDWDLFVESLAAMAGWEQRTTTLQFVRLMNAAMTQETTIKFFEAVRSSSVIDLLARISAPTLVLGRRELAWAPAEHFGRIAADIPNASHRTLEGSSGNMTDADAGAAITAFFASLRTNDQLDLRLQTSATAPQTAFRTVLFTDLVGHTEMMSRLGDERGREVLREHERITRAVLKAHGGTEVKTMGDGFMASFGSVTKAVECAVALQRAFAEHNSSAHPEALEGLSVRVGLNAGEPIEEDGDLFGATVILASRIAARADGGEILVADTVRGLCSGKGFLFADRGDFVAKGFEEPVRV